MAEDQVGCTYKEAEASFETLLRDPQAQKDRLNWISSINRFKTVYKVQPDGSRADDALFMIGHIFSELHKVSSEPHHRQEALDYYHRLLRRFPESPHCAEARKAIAGLKGKREGPAGAENVTAAQSEKKAI